MYSVRLWSVRHARGMEVFYSAFEKACVALPSVWNWIGYERVE